jgi:hypothetical protein
LEAKGTSTFSWDRKGVDVRPDRYAGSARLTYDVRGDAGFGSVVAALHVGAASFRSSASIFFDVPSPSTEFRIGVEVAAQAMRSFSSASARRRISDAFMSVLLHQLHDEACEDDGEEVTVVNPAMSILGRIFLMRIPLFLVRREGVRDFL